MSNHSSRPSRPPRASTRSGGAKTTERSGESHGKSGEPGKRERILDAAVRVFAKEGFYGAKVSQIAHAAGVADGTIYLYFKSKDDLLISLFEDRMDRVNSTLREAISSAADPVDCIRRIIRLHLELVEENRHMAEVVTVELRQSAKFIKEYANPKFGEFLRLIAGAVAEGQTSGRLRADVDPALFARALFGALDEIALAWLVKGKERIDLPRAAEQLANLFIDGLRVPHSQKATTP